MNNGVADIRLTKVAWRKWVITARFGNEHLVGVGTRRRCGKDLVEWLRRVGGLEEF